MSYVWNIKFSTPTGQTKTTDWVADTKRAARLQFNHHLSKSGYKCVSIKRDRDQVVVD